MTDDTTPDQPSGVVYLARHGRTALNADGRLRGHLDPPLDEVGAHEALRLAHALGRRGLSKVIASPLQRATDTAHAIAAEAGLEASSDVRLMDRDYGQWAGERLQDVRERWGDVDAAPGVETLPSVEQRVRSLLDEVARSLTEGPVVLVAHDAVNRILLASLDADLGDPDGIPQRTACWNELVLTPQGWSVTRIDQKDEPAS